LKTYRSQRLRLSAWLAASLLACAALAGAPARADRNDYAEVRDLVAESATLRVLHHHDWRVAMSEAQWRGIVAGEELDGGQGTLSYLRVLDKASGTQLFRRPVAALTHVWIDPRSNYIVGLSRIKLGNPHQLVVFDRRGVRLLARNLVGVDWPGKTESVSNWIDWYRQPLPKITLTEGKTMAVLSVQGPAGDMRSFAFARAR
jgi:hypothetical protein